MDAQEKDDILKMLVHAVVRANHILMACELAKEEDHVNGIVMPIAQVQTLGRTLGSIALAFTKTGLFTQEQIERHVIEQTKVQDAMNFTMQLISQGADDDLIESLLSHMGYYADHIQQLIAEARKLYTHIQKEHPEMLPFEFDHPFEKIVTTMTTPSSGTKH